MIRLTAIEHIKEKGDFKLDGLCITRFVFNNPPKGKQTLTFDVVPFSYMDNGDEVRDETRRKTVNILDAEDYLLNSGDVKFLNAYFATEDACAHLLSDRTEWKATFEAPQA